MDILRTMAVLIEHPFLALVPALVFAVSYAISRSRLDLTAGLLRVAYCPYEYGMKLVVGSNHGWNLLPIFFSNLAEMTWSDQFNFDFMTFLGLSAIWVAWRHQLTASAIALGIVAFFGGEAASRRFDGVGGIWARATI